MLILFRYLSTITIVQDSQLCDVIQLGGTIHITVYHIHRFCNDRFNRRFSMLKQKWILAVWIILKNRLSCQDSSSTHRNRNSFYKKI